MSNKQKIKLKMVLTSKIILTITSLLLFIVWLMFMTNNFYPKSQTLIVNYIMNIPIKIMIWPITGMILFIFIMPIWVTNNKKILLLFLTLSLLITILGTLFIFGLNINKYWFIWLVFHLFSISSLIFVMIVYFIDSSFYSFLKKKKANNTEKEAVQQ